MGIGEKERKEGNMWRRKKGEERGKKTKTKELWEWKKGRERDKRGRMKKRRKKGGGKKEREKGKSEKRERGMDISWELDVRLFGLGKENYWVPESI